MTGVAGATFPREARLLTPEAFARALKTRPFRGKFLWIYRVDCEIADDAINATEATNDGNESVPALALSTPRPQLGMMIGKRNAKSAVLRNAIKRRIREQFRLRAARLPARAYVVRLAATTAKTDVPLLLTEWVDALEFDIRKNLSNRPIKLGSAA
jgi:ribonuclease P protein component